MILEERLQRALQRVEREPLAELHGEDQQDQGAEGESHVGPGKREIGGRSGDQQDQGAKEEGHDAGGDLRRRTNFLVLRCHDLLHDFINEARERRAGDVKKIMGGRIAER